MEEVVNSAFPVLMFAAFLAVFVERVSELISETLKRLNVQENYISVAMPWLAIVVGVGISFAAQLDIYNAVAKTFSVPGVNLQINKTVSVIMSGVAIGGGSSYVHDLWSLVIDLRQQAQARTRQLNGVYVLGEEVTDDAVSRDT